MITIEPIGYVRNSRRTAEDDGWGGVESSIVLADAFDPESLLGIEDFSHAEIVFHFDQVRETSIIRTARHPRNNSAWPRVGIFAQRGKNRPNRLGSTIVRILAHHGRDLRVAGLDAIDGTPVVDIKPVLGEFLPHQPIRQPSWSRELMSRYWDAPEAPHDHGTDGAGVVTATSAVPNERAVHANEFARDKHPGMVGVRILTCEPDLVIGRLEVTPPLVAGTGFLWAPVVITLADWLCAAGMGANLTQGESFTTIELKTNFLGTVREGGAICGRATPIHRGRATHVWDVEVADEANGKVIALFRCTQMVLRPRT